MGAFNNYVTLEFTFFDPPPTQPCPHHASSRLQLDLERDVTISELPPPFPIENHQTSLKYKIITF